MHPQSWTSRWLTNTLLPLRPARWCGTILAGSEIVPKHCAPGVVVGSIETPASHDFQHVVHCL